MGAPSERPTGVTHVGRRWSNAEQDRVEIEPYDPAWPARFEAEAASIRAALGDGDAAHASHPRPPAPGGRGGRAVPRSPDRIR
jgi:hypothetical protein